jgi:hypothetical protein
MKYHELILSKDQKKVFHALKGIKEYLKKRKIFLFGGTALALQIGHRRSYDFDFMTSQAIKAKEVSQQLKTVLPELHIVREKENTLDCEWKSAKLSFFGGITRPCFFPPVPYDHLMLLSIPDILSMKISAMMERNVFGDYFDIATVLQFEGITMPNLIQWFYKKYGKEAHQFHVSWVLKCITFLSDVPAERQIITKHQDFWKGDQKKRATEILEKKMKDYLEGK